MAVPVLGIPVIARPEELADCVRSIDAEVSRLVIVDNGPVKMMGDVARSVLPPNIHELVVIEPPANLGFSASLNLLIKMHAQAPWWAWANADVVFAPGDIDRVVTQMDAADGPFLCGIRDHRLFGLNAAMVETIGLWDENFHPVYCEDVDYMRRVMLGGARFLMIPGETRHVGSATIQEPYYRERNTRTYPQQRIYYARKWGGDIGRETFTTPFDRGGTVADWTLDLRRLRELSWDRHDGD